MDEKLLGQLLQENWTCREELRNLKASYAELCGTLNDLVKYISQMDNRIHNNTNLGSILYNRVRNLPYEMLDPRFPNKYAIPQIMTEEETIDKIVNERKSISRFGDGEFGIMFGDARWRFQRNDAKLAERLREVVTSKDDDILIGINNFYGDLSHRTDMDAEGIRSYIVPEVRAQHMQLLELDRVYAHAFRGQERGKRCKINGVFGIKKIVCLLKEIKHVWE